VYDGRGIAPDVHVDEPDLPKVVGGLYTAELFFDFANQYKWTHPTIAPPEEFAVTDEIYQEFLAFVKDKKFDYRTESLDDLNKLEADAKKERYYDHAKAAIDALRAELSPDRSEELQRFQNDIREVLKSEIVGRYYHQTGRAKAMLTSDPVVQRALAVLNGTEYAGVLNGTIKTN
jgi:carboxyl-terminal processing protease